MNTKVEVHLDSPELEQVTAPVIERKYDSRWVLSFYGTAIGAGTLFLPIEAGINGLLPLLIMIVLALPMTYFSHRALCRVVLASQHKSSNITDVMEEFFGAKAGLLLTLLYFLSIFPILLMYGVALVNTIYSFMANQLAIETISRNNLALMTMTGFFLIIRLGQDRIMKCMGLLVYPFVASLILLSLYLIPHWSSSFLTALPEPGAKLPSTVASLWMLIPVIVFSFNHSPIISVFAVAQKKKYGDSADKQCSKLLMQSHVLMVITVIFFVLSCVFSLSPQDLHQAQQDNVSVLSYLANVHKNPIITFFAPLLAIVAITKSFLGHYIGAKEGLHGLLLKITPKDSSYGKLGASVEKGTEVAMIIACWLCALLNPSILTIIESISGPAIAIMLFIVPMLAKARVHGLKKYNNPWADKFIWTIGLVALSAIFYPFILRLL